MKALIFISLTVGGILGGWIGSMLDGGWGIWSMLFGLIIGPALGIYIGYKIGKNYVE